MAKFFLARRRLRILHTPPRPEHVSVTDVTTETRILWKFQTEKCRDLVATQRPNANREPPNATIECGCVNWQASGLLD